MAAPSQFKYASIHILRKEIELVYLSYFLIGSIVMLLFLAMVWIYTNGRRRAHGNQAEEPQASLGIELVPLCASSESEIEDVTCVICISDIEHGQEFIKLPCVHYYHMQCIDQWLQISPRCPICCKDYSRRSLAEP